MSSCETCGFTPKGKTPAMRAKGMNGHSCTHQAMLQARAVRAAAKRDCPKHLGYYGQVAS